MRGSFTPSYDAIHRANPRALVALGGLMDTGAGGRAWTSAMLATPATDAAHKVRRRQPSRAFSGRGRRWGRLQLAGLRRQEGLCRSPVGDRDRLPSRRFRARRARIQGRRFAQARWLSNAIPATIRAGAAKVFVTERDSLTGRYASGRVLQTGDPRTALPPYVRRPSFYAVRHLAVSRRRATTARPEQPDGTPIEAVGEHRGVLVSLAAVSLLGTGRQSR